jgi:hypothetical protein
MPLDLSITLENFLKFDALDFMDLNENIGVQTSNNRNYMNVNNNTSFQSYKNITEFDIA